MDVKSAFLNGFIEKEVYVKQAPDFEDHTFPYCVFKLKMTLYGLKQTLYAWYDKLSFFSFKEWLYETQKELKFHIKQDSKGTYICQQKHPKRMAFQILV